jgi:LacI family transcriptional regulator
VTLKQIAEMAGCSTAVVSTVLNNSRSTLAVSENTRLRVQEIARVHNYRPHLAARMMKSRKSYQVGVLLMGTMYGNLPHPAVFETVLGINEGLERAGYLMSLVRMTDIEKDNLLSTRLFEGHLLDGLIVVSLINLNWCARSKAWCRSASGSIQKCGEQSAAFGATKFMPGAWRLRR